MSTIPLPTDFFVITHKDVELKLGEGYELIHAGACLSDSNIRIKDNVGDNISSLNHHFCELTAQYWVWKNYPLAGNCGFVHYRRFFYHKHLSCNANNHLRSDDASRYLEEHDWILPDPIALRTSVEDDYSTYHYREDLESIYQIVERLHPTYVSSWNQVMRGNTLCPYNMFVTSRDSFHAYMEWLFGILFESMSSIDYSTYDDYNKRVFGFIAERLLNVWIKKNAESPMYLPVYQTGVSPIRWEIKRVVKRACYGAIHAKRRSSSER